MESPARRTLIAASEIGLNGGIIKAAEIATVCWVIAELRVLRRNLPHRPYKTRVVSRLQPNADAPNIWFKGPLRGELLDRTAIYPINERRIRQQIEGPAFAVKKALVRLAPTI